MWVAITSILHAFAIVVAQSDYDMADGEGIRANGMSKRCEDPENVNTRDGEVKIIFGNSINRPIRDPDSLQTRRLLSDTQTIQCTALGRTAGALIAKRLLLVGSPSKDYEEFEDVVVDLQTFVELAVTTATRSLFLQAACPRDLIHNAATDMTQTVLCNMPTRSLISTRRSNSNFLNLVKNYLPNTASNDCEGHHFNLNSDRTEFFNNNPEEFIRKLTYHVADETLKVANKSKPIEAPAKFSATNMEYFKSTVIGSVISSHLCKVLSSVGQITDKRTKQSYPLPSFISTVVAQVTQKITSIPISLAFKVTNVVIKTSMFWLVNNYKLIQNTPAELMTYNTLINLGMTNDFAGRKKLKTINKPITSNNIFIHFRDLEENGEDLINIIIDCLQLNEMTEEIDDLLQGDVPAIPDEVVRIVVEPVTPAKVVDLFTTSGRAQVGVIPKPSKWYTVQAPDGGKSLDVALTGALAGIIGSHAGMLATKFGLITLNSEPGYNELANIDIYQLIQDLNQKIIIKLMSVLPMKLQSGFYMLNGAFKVTKLVLNLRDLPNDFGNRVSDTYIPLAFKKFKLISFFPELQNIQLDLIPLPISNRVLQIWVKTNLRAKTHQVIKERMEKVVNKHFPDVLEDIINIFKNKLSNLTIYNIKDMPEKLAEVFSWDPPEIMTFIYEPPTADGTVEATTYFREVPKRPLRCPGHFLCLDDSTNSTIPSYACTTLDPWCYFPKGFTCPSDIHCPVELIIKDKKVICPDDPNCPVINIPCPGRSECPDERISCPGNPKCPLEIKCPGKACPQRYMSKSQQLLPCPNHPLCSQQPIPNQLTCLDAHSCTYSKNSSEILTALNILGNKIIKAIDKKIVTVNVENKVSTNVSINGTVVTNSEVNTKIKAGNSSTTAMASTTASQDKGSSAAAATSSSQGQNSSAAAAAAASQGQKSSAAAASAADKSSSRNGSKGTSAAAYDRDKTTTTTPVTSRKVEGEQNTQTKGTKLLKLHEQRNERKTTEMPLAHSIESSPKIINYDNYSYE